MSGPQKVSRPRLRIEQLLDRRRAIVRRDAGRRHAARLNRDGKGRFVHGRVFSHHLRNVKLVEAGADHRHTNQAAGAFTHEVNGVGRDHLGRHHQVALVLAVLIIEHHHHLAGPNIDDRIGDGIEGALPLRELFAKRRKDVGQPLQGAVGRLPAPGA